jgi:hypothetical protein
VAGGKKTSKAFPALALGGEKILQQCGGFVGEDSGGDFDAVVDLRVVEDGEAGPDGAAFGVVGAIEEAGDARLDHGAGAHGAGFNGDVESGIEEAVIFHLLGGSSEGHDFGVCGGVAVGNGAIAGTDDDATVEDNHGANGHFAALGRFAGFIERRLHEGDVGVRGIRHRGPE